jgi:hypothetical protein
LISLGARDDFVRLVDHPSVALEGKRTRQRIPAGSGRRLAIDGE